ncbi:MAG: GNAT family N-acetyltransferase [bacterium]
MGERVDFSKISFRYELEANDKDLVAQITGSSRCFSEKEVSVAIELVEERLAKGEKSGYYFIFSEHLEKILGYICFGPDAGTESSYHIYWLAVDNEHRKEGIGRCLLQEAEKVIRKMGGSHIYIETSSRDCYMPARVFYEKNGYKREALLEDFYSEGDGKVIYSKKI